MLSHHEEGVVEIIRNLIEFAYERHKTKRLALIYERKAAIYEYIQDVKNQSCCADCGERHPATLHFHHLNSEDKLFNIAEAVNKGFSLDKIKKEIKKCIVLCANCHAIRHFNLRNKKQTSPGIAAEFEKLNTLLAISSEEEDAYREWFGHGGDVEQ